MATKKAVTRAVVSGGKPAGKGGFRGAVARGGKAGGGGGGG